MKTDLKHRGVNYINQLRDFDRLDYYLIEDMVLLQKNELLNKLKSQQAHKRTDEDLRNLELLEIAFLYVLAINENYPANSKKFEDAIQHKAYLNSELLRAEKKEKVSRKILQRKENRMSLAIAN